MTRRARDLMQRRVFSVTPKTALLDAHQLFVEEEINSAPVLDEARKVIGVVTSADLVRAVDDLRDAAALGASLLPDLPPDVPRETSRVPEDLQDRLGGLRVGDVMTEGVLSVSPATSIVEIARIFREQRVHHVLVVDDGELVGVISTFDLMRVIEEEVIEEEMGTGSGEE